MTEYRIDSTAVRELADAWANLANVAIEYQASWESFAMRWKGEEDPGAHP